MLHSYVTDMAARVTPTIQIPMTEPKIQTTNFLMQYLLRFNPIEPQNHHQPIHRAPVNHSSTIVRLSKAGADIR